MTVIDKKKLLTPIDKERTISDAAGIIPFITGAFPKVPVDGRGLYLEHPIFSFNPPSVDVRSGKWSNFTGKALGKVKHAMDVCKFKMSDVLLHIHAHGTPLGKILNAAKAVETVMLEDLVKRTDHIKKHNAICRLAICKTLVEMHLKSPSTQPALKKKIKEAIKKSKTKQFLEMMKVPLVQNNELQNESFNAMDSFDTFYNHLIGNAENKHTDVYSKGDNGQETETPLNSCFQKQEGMKITSALNCIRIYHKYYDDFVAKADLMKAESKPNLELEKVANKLGNIDISIDDSKHREDGCTIISGFIWKIIVERFEILSSIVKMYLSSLAGPGCKEIGSMTNKLTDNLIFYCMNPLFEAKACKYDYDKLSAIVKTNPNDPAVQICHAFHVHGSHFLEDFKRFTAGVVLRDMKVMTTPASIDKKELDTKIQSFLLKQKTWNAIELSDKLVIKDLSISSVIEDMKVSFNDLCSLDNREIHTSLLPRDIKNEGIIFIMKPTGFGTNLRIWTNT